MDNKIKYIAIFGVVACVLCSCSTQKNTWASRSYHQTTTRFNVLFNGKLSYEEGMQAINKANVDNYTDVLPLFPISNHETTTAATSQMDKTIEKCRKSIKLHSIKKKPKRDPKKSGDPKYKAWLAQEEFNENLDDAWLLLGCAEFHKGDFLGSVGTFNYIAKHYEYDKDMVAQCQLWTARAYMEMGWLYEAEDIIRKTNQDDLTKKHAGLYASTYADYLIKTKQYKEAIPFLTMAVKKEKRSGYKARFTFILAQLHERTGNKNEAKELYKQVVSMQPEEALGFNAKLKMNSLDGSDKAIKRLNRMAKDYKNKDRLEIVYGAIGDIYLSRKDTAKALENYDLAIEKATQSNAQKGAVLITAADLYYEQKNYVKAQPYYQEASTIYSVDFADYQRIRKLADMLGELVVEYNTVQLQDSLQHLASLPEDSQMVVINAIIDRLKEQEAKEKELAEQKARGDFDDNGLLSVNTANMLGGNGQNADWYFYNANLIRQGKQEFTRKWGNRTLEDDWRHSNKIVFTTSSTNNEDLVQQADTIPTDSTQTQTIPPSSDPHEAQYYLQQLPTTQQQIDASNQLIEKALNNMVYIYRDKIEDLDLAQATLDELQRRFPQSPYLCQIYYDKYIEALKKHDNENIATYKQLILTDYPNSKEAAIVADPDYFNKLQHAEEIQDSLYEATYKAYLQGDYVQVKSNTQYAEEHIPMSNLMPRMLFLNAVAVAKTEPQQHFVDKLRDLTTRFPESEQASMAKDMLAMMNQEMEVKQGADNNVQLLEMRSEQQMAEDTTSLFSMEWSAERATTSFVVVVVPEQEEPTSINNLNYQIALFNFSQFLIKEFDTEIVQHFNRDLSAIKIIGFDNMDEAQWYANLLTTNSEMSLLLTQNNAQIICITDPNYHLLITRFTLAEYINWFNTQK